MEAFSRRGNNHAGFLLDCGPRTTPRCRHAAASRSCFTSQENCLAWRKKDRAPQKLDQLGWLSIQGTSRLEEAATVGGR